MTVKLPENSIYSIYRAHHLFFTVLLHGLHLIESLQSTIHSLIESPRLFNRNIKLIDRLQHHVPGENGPLQERGEHTVKLKSRLFNLRSTLCSLFAAQIRQSNIDPPGKLVRRIPFRLAMADKHHSRERLGFLCFRFTGPVFCAVTIIDILIQSIG